jgi:hypothetical protein
MTDRRPLHHRIVEALLPWYDRRREVAHDDRTEAIRQRSIRARIKAEEVVEAYRTAPWPRR